MGWRGHKRTGASLSSTAPYKKKAGEATNEVKGIEFKQFSLGRREGDPQSATPA